MNRMTKRLINLALAVCMVVAIGGCSTQNSQDTAAPVPTATSQEASHHKDKNMQQCTEETLKRLTADNTITEEQSQKVAAYFHKMEEEHKLEHVHLKNLKEDARKAAAEEHSLKYEALKDKLAEECSHTEHQAKAILAGIKPHHEDKSSEQPEKPANP